MQNVATKTNELDETELIGFMATKAPIREFPMIFIVSLLLIPIWEFASGAWVFAGIATMVTCFCLAVKAAAKRTEEQRNMFYMSTFVLSMLAGFMAGSFILSLMQHDPSALRFTGWAICWLASVWTVFKYCAPMFRFGTEA